MKANHYGIIALEMRCKGLEKIMEVFGSRKIGSRDILAWYYQFNNQEKQPLDHNSYIHQPPLLTPKAPATQSPQKSLPSLLPPHMSRASSPSNSSGVSVLFLLLGLPATRVFIFIGERCFLSLTASFLTGLDFIATVVASASNCAALSLSWTVNLGLRSLACGLVEGRLRGVCGFKTSV